MAKNGADTGRKERKIPGDRLNASCADLQCSDEQRREEQEEDQDIDNARLVG